MTQSNSRIDEMTHKKFYLVIDGERVIRCTRKLWKARNAQNAWQRGMVVKCKIVFRQPCRPVPEEQDFEEPVKS